MKERRGINLNLNNKKFKEKKHLLKKNLEKEKGKGQALLGLTTCLARVTEPLFFLLQL